MLGASGVGKGTQAMKIAEHFGIKHISTGDLLREEVKTDNRLSRAISRLIDAGNLVPDELMLSIIQEILENEKGFVLDGFPRTYAQALELTEMCGNVGTNIDLALNLDVPDHEILQRITGRKVCPECKAMFHIIFYPTKEPGICDICNTRLEQRPDDTAKTVRHRLKVYHERTAPIIDYYRRLDMLVSASGTGDAEYISRSLISLLEETIRNGGPNADSD